MSYLENSRIKLRALEPSDVELLYLWENDTDLWQVSDTLSPFSRDILQQYIESAHKSIHEQKQLRLAIDVKDTEAYHTVGLIDLFDIDFLHRRAGVGILIYAVENRKKGYASDALELLIAYCFEVLSLHQLYCHIPMDNTASIRLFTNVGFEYIGTLKEWRKTPKGWQNVQLMQLI
ncbi:MAG: GNAT family N-acetyltransferase [Prevotellaceae bacterium]|jgi:diamine N-acetyltransferase|nr:GNAT family N-acetyltransferase [Prevotellaceae bacterium]